MESRKRKLPARAARTEGGSKKRISEPPEPRTQTPTPSAAPTPPVEEPLPKSIAPGKPLPTLDAPQPEDLPSSQYQSVSESGVLAESLKRSRQAWISEGIFERYWTKITKKKGAPEVTNNPGKETMTKLGTCTITCEPHVLDAIMYAIKEPNRPVIPTTPQQYPAQQRPIIQYGPPNGTMPPPPPVSMHHPKPISQLTPQPSPRPRDAEMSNSAGTNGQPTATPNAAPQQQNRGTDPVIQMLAERAATDTELKALMRIVANGEATPEELKKFQAHIDELTRIQRARAAGQAQTDPAASPNTKPSAPSTPQLSNGMPAKSIQSPAQVARPAPTPTPPPQPQYTPQPQALRSKGPVPSARPDISGVVFEFTGGSGDRFLFPKFSILEYLPGGQVIASFLIVRKGSSSDAPGYDPKLDYYQPITIRLFAHQGRQLDALQKVVAPPDEVRRYMDDVMDNTTRAEYVLLAMRLPKETKEKETGTPVSEKETEVSQPAPVAQVSWVTTAPTTIAPKPITVTKASEKLLSEEEKYRNFIATVS